MPKPPVDLWGDGSTYPANPGRGGWGTILVHNQTLRALSGHLPKATNNHMEVLAVIRGLEVLAFPCTVTVYTDSAYVINGVNAILNKRRLGSNPDLWETMAALMQVHILFMRKVKAHGGVILNEWANDLAAEAAIHTLDTDGYVACVPEAYTRRAERKAKAKARRAGDLAS